MISRELLMDNAWRYNIHQFAHRASGGTWHPYTWAVMMLRIVQMKILEGNARIILSAPPRHGKSEGISKWLPTWFLYWYPELRIILSSYNHDFASKWGMKVRDEFLFNPLLKDIKIKPNVRGNSFWQTEEGGSMLCTGAGGGITGMGFNLGIIDDPIKNREDAHSPILQERLREWYPTTFYTRREPNASIIVMATRWTDADFLGYLINEDPDDWIVINFPAIAEEGDEYDLLERAPGEALCPERFTAKVLEQNRKVMGTYSFEAMYQGRPVPLKGGIIKKDWVQHYTETPNDLVDLRQSWDLTFDSSSSYVTGQTWAKKGPNYYLLDQVRGRWEFPEQIRQIKQFREKWGAKKIFIEKAANGAAAISTLKEEIAGIVPVTVSGKGSKEVRLIAVSGLFESRNVYIPSPLNMPWVNEYIKELVTFPASANDDQVDATSQALNSFSTANYNLGFSMGSSGKQDSSWRAINE